MAKNKPAIKPWILISAVALLSAIIAGVLLVPNLFSGENEIRLDNSNVYFEFGKKINLPDTTVYNGSGKEIAYDSICVGMVAPDGSEVDISSGYVTPMMEGTYVLTYASVSQKTKTEINIECRDTIFPTLNVEVPAAFLIKEQYEDTDFTVFTLPIISADDLAGIDSEKTDVKITCNGNDVPLNGDQFVLTEEGDLVFTFTVYDLNGLSTTVTKESIAEAPEYFDTYCLSTFAKDTYLTKLCGGWLNSYYEAELLESDTDPSGTEMEGVLKITYDSSDREAGACIHLAKPVKREDIEYLAVTLRLENASVTAEVIDAVFYKSGYKEGFWTISNVSATVGSSYKTIYIGKSVLDTMVESDGYIRELQIETFGDEVNARSLYIADVSYGPAGSKMPENSAVVSGNSGGSGGTTGNLTDDFPEFCLSTFAKDAYKNHMCGGWLNSKFTSKILSSDTDPSGTKMEGVLKITYPASDKEASACIHLGRAVKLTDVKSLEITLRLENGKVIDNGTVDAVIFKAGHKDGYWTVANKPVLAGKNYVTISITDSALNRMADADGYIRQFQIETFGDGKTERTLYLADISYTPAENQEPVDENTLVIYGANNSTADTAYFKINKETGLSDWTNIAKVSNEEDFILINDKAWSNQEIGAISGKCFYVHNIRGKVGTKITIKKGFAVTFNENTYETAKDYNFWWDGKAWVATEIPSEEEDEPQTPETPKIPELTGNCLSAFDGSGYEKLLCGGWLNSKPQVTVLGSDTDAAGTKMDGVLKLSYPASDKEASACLHLGREVKLSEVKSLEVTLRLENGKVIDNGTVDTVFFKADHKDGYWTVANKPVLVGKNYVTISITGNALNRMADADGYIRQFQIETFGDGKTERTLYLADISYKPVASDVEPEPSEPSVPSEPSTPSEPAGSMDLVVAGVSGQNANQLMMTLPTDPNVKVGTKMTVQSGFTVTIDGVDYGTAQNYDFWWNGSEWTTEEVMPDQTLVITSLGATQSNIIYFKINAETGVSDWTNIAGKCNEETHILVNDTPWTNQELGGIAGKCFYINNIGATIGTKVTIKQGFTAKFNGTNYITDKDYNYWWDGTTWTTQEVEIPEPEVTEPEVTEPEATEPSELPENCLSAFDSSAYLELLCGGWLASKSETTILESDTDTAGKTENGVLKITYPVSDREASACVHLAKPVQRAGVESLDITLQLENGKIIDAGTTSVVIYKAEFYDGYWSVQNKSTLVGQEYVTIKITGKILDSLTDADGYIRQFQIETFGDRITSRSLYLADISYTPASQTPDPDNTLVISGTGNSTANTVYFKINTATGLSDWTNIASKCNEETHILINDQAWSTQEIGAVSGQYFYVNKIGGVVGTKITVKKGFSVVFNGVTYVADQDYHFWWNGSKWITEEVPTTGE